MALIVGQLDELRKQAAQMQDELNRLHSEINELVGESKRLATLNAQMAQAHTCTCMLARTHKLARTCLHKSARLLVHAGLHAQMHTRRLSSGRKLTRVSPFRCDQSLEMSQHT